jgi:hypothetical protein
MFRRALVVVPVAALALLFPAPAHAAKPSASVTCTVDGSTVSVEGLPLDVVTNFFVTDSSGKTGWVLGVSGGWWDVEVPQANGPTTYEFASRTWGSGGSKYAVYASCSA